MDQTKTTAEKEKKSLLQYSELRTAIEALNTYSDGLPDKLNDIEKQIPDHLTIQDDGAKKKAKKFLSSINANPKEIKARRLDVTRFLDEAKKRFTNREQELSAPFNEYASKIEEAIARYDEEVIRQRQEEEARRLKEQQEKEAAAKAAREEAIKADQKEGDARISAQEEEDWDEVEKWEKEKKEAAEAAERAEREAQRAKEIAEYKAAENARFLQEQALKSTKKDAFSHYEITDFEAIPEDLIEISFNFLKIRGYIKEHGAVPGMRVTAKNGYIFDGSIPTTNKHID